MTKSPEQIMWQSVVYRAALDATGIDAREKRDADNWFRRAGSHFRAVVTMAGMDPDFVRDAYIAGRVDRDLLRAAAER